MPTGVYVRTEETRMKISTSLKGKPKSKKHREHLSAVQKGKHLSEDHRIKISISMMGKIRTEVHRKHLIESNRGKKRSEKTRRKISESHIGLQRGSNNGMWNGGIFQRTIFHRLDRVF